MRAHLYSHRARGTRLALAGPIQICDPHCSVLDRSAAAWEWEWEWEWEWQAAPDCAHCWTSPTTAISGPTTSSLLRTSQAWSALQPLRRSDGPAVDPTSFAIPQAGGGSGRPRCRVTQQPLPCPPGPRNPGARSDRGPSHSRAENHPKPKDPAIPAHHHDTVGSIDISNRQDD